MLDIDPDNIYFDHIPKRIYDTFGADVKFIVVLRNPADRAYSHYLMETFRNRENLSFREALNAEEDRIKDSNGNFYHSYKRRGLYYSQLKKYFDFFPREHFLFFIFETDFLQNRKSMVANILRFLEVTNCDDLNINISSNMRKQVKSQRVNRLINNNNQTRFIARKLLPKGLRNRLRRALVQSNTSRKEVEKIPEIEKKKLIKTYYSDEIENLENLLEIDLSIWKN